MVIPALDEEGAIASVIAAIPRAGEGFEVREVVVVDNGSTDRTAEAARAAGATVVREDRRGYGAACLAGIAYLRGGVPAPAEASPRETAGAKAALPAHPDVVVFLDGDASDDPAELPLLLAPIVRDRADLVIGSRVLGAREPGALTPVQEFGNRLAASLLRALFGASFTDLGPFRAIRWESLESLRMRDRDYGWTVEMQARALRAGLRCAEVPVRYRRRTRGSSKVSGTLRGTIGAGWKILSTIGRVRLGG